MDNATRGVCESGLPGGQAGRGLRAPGGDWASLRRLSPSWRRRPLQNEVAGFPDLPPFINRHPPADARACLRALRASGSLRRGAPGGEAWECKAQRGRRQPSTPGPRQRRMAVNCQTRWSRYRANDSGGSARPHPSDRSAIRPHDLTVDPAAVRPDQKRHDARNILRLTEAAERAAGPGGFDLRLGLAGHEKVRFD